MSLKEEFGRKKKRTKCVFEPEEAKIVQMETDYSTKDYAASCSTYDELLTRLFSYMRENSKFLAAPKSLIIKPPRVSRVGTKKTCFVNFSEICQSLHRSCKHLMDFLLAELATDGSIDSNSQLIIKGRFNQRQIEEVLLKYIKDYVKCRSCKMFNTVLQKSDRLLFIACNQCDSTRTVSLIKPGFHAITKRTKNKRSE